MKVRDAQSKSPRSGGLSLPAPPRRWKPTSSFLSEQTNLTHLDFHRLRREFPPRLGFFPDTFLDRSQLLLLSLLMRTPVGRLLALLGSSLLCRPLHISVARPGGSVFGSDGLGRDSLFTRRGLLWRNSGLRRCSGLLRSR